MVIRFLQNKSFYFVYYKDWFLGPMLFSLYSSPVGKITRTYGLCVWLDADDTQLF